MKNLFAKCHSFCYLVFMSFSDYLIEHSYVTYPSEHGWDRFSIASLNIFKTACHVIPIVNIVFGILALKERLPYICKYESKTYKVLFITAASICIAGLGIFLIPFIVAGTILKLKSQREQNTPPPLSVRQVAPIKLAPDWLL